MKKKNLFITAALSFLLGLGVFAGVSSVSKSKSTVKVEAASTMVSGSRVYIEDQHGTSSGWTKDGVDAIMHVYSVSFVSGSGYTSLGDVKLNDLYATSFATDGSTYMNIRMKWSESGSGQRYEAILPWYISSFTTEFYATDGSDRYLYNKDGGAKYAISVSRGNNQSVYLYGATGWDGNKYYSYISAPTAATGYQYEFNGIKSGSHMYLSTSDISGWEWDDAKIAINFGKSNINKGDAWSCQYNITHTAFSTAFCWKVKGSGDDHLFECIVPKYNGQDVYWSMVIGVRLSSSASSPGWSNVLNQSGDQFYNGDDRDCNMLWVNPATGGDWSGGGYLRNDRTISDDTRAGYYGTYFLSQITCDGDGNITSSYNNWTTVKNEYNQHLADTVRLKIWETDAAATGSDLVKAMYKYDYIVFHKQYADYDDFISRDDSEGLAFARAGYNILGINRNELTGVIVVVIISLLSVATIGGYFFIKKKKSN